MKNNVTNAEDRIIIEAVFGTYVGMTKNRIKRIKQAAGGAHVVELWGANHFAFLSNEADVLRELRAFQGTLQSRRKPARLFSGRHHRVRTVASEIVVAEDYTALLRA
ncbi:MAG: hypothetical protein WCB11_26035 [Terriglobales bacterium]